MDFPQTFLDDLLSFKHDLKQGAQAVKFLRSGRIAEWFNKNPGPADYRKHLTKGGLYLVLPHRSDGSLYIPRDLEDNFRREKVWKKNNPWVYLNFYLDKVVEAKVEQKYGSGISGIGQKISKRNGSEKHEHGKVILGSRIVRDDYCRERDMKVQISTCHSVDERGNLFDLIIDYEFMLPNLQEYKKVVFHVYRDANTQAALMEGPDVETNLKPFGLSPDEFIEPETTMSQLVDLITQKTLTPNDFMFLFHLSYVDKILLH